MLVLSILWAWHSCAGRECRGGQRGTERQRAKKIKINSHRHATLHQDCYFPEREKGGFEGLIYAIQGPLQKERKTKDWKEMKVRVGIEKKKKNYLISLYRQRKRWVGQETDSKRIVMKKDGARGDMGWSKRKSELWKEDCFRAVREIKEMLKAGRAGAARWFLFVNMHLMVNG